MRRCALFSADLGGTQSSLLAISLSTDWVVGCGLWVTASMLIMMFLKYSRGSLRLRTRARALRWLRHKADKRVNGLASRHGILAQICRVFVGLLQQKRQLCFLVSKRTQQFLFPPVLLRA